MGDPLVKKLLSLSNTPARAVLAVGLIVLLTEYMIMVLFDVIRGGLSGMEEARLVRIFNYLDPILLVALVSPALYILIFRPMRRQQELEVARRSIEHSYREWMAALDVVADPIFLHDREFRILRCNRAYRQQAGLPFRHIIGRPYYEIFPKAGAPLPGCLRALAQAGEETEEEEVAVGETIYHSRSFSVNDEQGAHLYSVHLLEDISERKQAEQALQQGEADLMALVEHSPVAIIVDVGADVDEKVTVMNQKFTELFGYTLKDVPAVRHWWPLAYPDEQYREALKAEWAEKVEKAIQSHGSIEPMETTVTCKDGSTRQVRISLASIGSRNIVTFEDFTKSKQAEAELAEQLAELRRWHEITSGREKRILAIKHEVNELLAQAGQPPRYPSAESQDQTEE